MRARIPDVLMMAGLGCWILAVLLDSLKPFPLGAALLGLGFLLDLRASSQLVPTIRIELYGGPLDGRVVEVPNAGLQIEFYIPELDCQELYACGIPAERSSSGERLYRWVPREEVPL